MIPRQPHDFWQAFLPPGTAAPPPPWQTGYPASLPDGRILMLPIRPLQGTDTAIASLILGQAAFAVEEALADHLAAQVAETRAEVVVGLPTLGLSLARAVAQRLGHRRFVPLGTSRKFWYDEGLSVPMSSITSPDATKRLYLDPRMQPLLKARRILLVDDVISTGRSITAGLRLLQQGGHAAVAVAAAMLQTERWQGALGETPAHGVIHSPLLWQVPGGWDLGGDGGDGG